MDRPVKRLEIFLAHPVTIFLATFSSIGSFLWMIYDKFTKNYPSSASIALFIISIVFFVLVHLLTIKVRNSNSILLTIPKTIHEINHIYRDKLYEVFHSDNPIDDKSVLIKHEKETIKAVLERISSLFTALIGRECTATVKIVVRDDDNKNYCYTYVRSIAKSPRDSNPPERYQIGVGKNTAFDKASMKSIDKPSHFYSHDLSKEDDYNNERSNHKKYYLSAIVVPIRHCHSNSERQDLMGYLCIDTLSVNRLNSKDHLQLMSAFADQMYNFTSLMRGKYSVLVG